MSEYLETRRECLQKLVYLGAAIFTGCSMRDGAPSETQQIPVPTLTPAPTPETAPAKIYQGPLEDLRGKPELGRARLAEILNELLETNNPFLTHLAVGIDTVRSSKSAPPNFPKWVSPDSFPLPITYDNSGKSFASGTVHANTSVPAVKFKIIGSDRSESMYDAVHSMTLGIHLSPVGSPLKKESNIVEGLILSRLYLTHLLMLRTSMEIFEFLNAQGAKFTDKAGNEIADRKEQERAGASFYLRTLSNENGKYYKMFNMVPVLMMGVAVGSLHKDYKFLQTSEHLSLIYEAVDELKNNNNALSLLSGLVSAWSGDGGLLPPRGTTGTIFQDDIIKSAFAVNEKKKQGPRNPAPQV